jgi:hypothetical protein
MDVELTQEESEAVRQALQSYLSDLRMEITDTDNPEYRRTLRAERAHLESAVAKLGGMATADGAQAAVPEEQSAGDEPAGVPTLRVVRLWWSSSGS